MPLAAIGAREEVPPCCATVLGAYACRQVALRCETVLKLQLAVVGLRRRHLYGRTRHSVLSAPAEVPASCRGRGTIETRRKQCAHENLRNEPFS